MNLAQSLRTLRRRCQPPNTAPGRRGLRKAPRDHRVLPSVECMQGRATEGQGFTLSSASGSWFAAGKPGIRVWRGQARLGIRRPFRYLARAHRPPPRDCRDYCRADKDSLMHWVALRSSGSLRGMPETGVSSHTNDCPLWDSDHLIAGLLMPLSCRFLPTALVRPRPVRSRVHSVRSDSRTRRRAPHRQDSTALSATAPQPG